MGYMWVPLMGFASHEWLSRVSLNTDRQNPRSKLSDLNQAIDFEAFVGVFWLRVVPEHAKRLKGGKLLTISWPIHRDRPNVEKGQHVLRR